VRVDCSINQRVNVNIANIPMPTAEERAEMAALDAKLDAFAAMLKAKTSGGGDQA